MPRHKPKVGVSFKGSYKKQRASPFPSPHGEEWSETLNIDKRVLWSFVRHDVEHHVVGRIHGLLAN